MTLSYVNSYTKNHVDKSIKWQLLDTNKLEFCAFKYGRILLLETKSNKSLRIVERVSSLRNNIKNTQILNMCPVL